MFEIKPCENQNLEVTIFELTKKTSNDYYVLNVKTFKEPPWSSLPKNRKLQIHQSALSLFPSEPSGILWRWCWGGVGSGVGRTVSVRPVPVRRPETGGFRDVRVSWRDVTTFFFVEGLSYSALKMCSLSFLSFPYFSVCFLSFRHARNVILVALRLVNFFVLLVIARYHDIFEGRH